MTEAHTDPDLLYVGTYTEDSPSKGIYLVRMDRRSGELIQVGAADAGPNPSFVAIHPSGATLYAVNELDHGTVTALAIDRASGGLTKINSQPSEGGAPCYISVDRSGRVALVANYGTGSVALLPLQANGALGSVAFVDKHTGTGPIADRQEGPHAHCILPDSSNRFALSADLGADRVLIYHLDIESKSLPRIFGGAAVMRAGAGPRHIAFHPTLPLVFVSNELDSTVATLHFDAARGMLTLRDTRATVPATWSGTNYPADIHISASGHTVYVSNRGHNSIAVFSVAESTGALALEQVVSTEGDWPRNFSLSPSGQWLLAANQRSDSIVVFAREPESGRLTSTSQRIAIPSPVCLRFA
ncbi:MAG TPA: lactonase family protein [Gemmatimonadales bacterium]|nr:lactonase family protein [Gemmatimonadales bacterium]